MSYEANKNILQEKYLEFLEHLENKPWDEIPEVLEEIEELILEIISGNNYLVEKHWENRDNVERKILAKITGDSKNIAELLDDLNAKVSQILKKSPEDIDRELWIFVKHLDWIILPPWEGGREEWKWESEKREEKELIESRYGKILEILRENEIYVDDIIVYSANLRDNQMRTTSYRVIQIPSISKTIFVCDEYGEASFVCDSLVYPEVFLEANKSEIREQLDVERIVHSIWWEERFIEATFWEREQEIILQKSQQRNKKVSVRELDEYRQEILRQFPTPEEFMNRPVRERFWEIVPGISSLRMYGIVTWWKVRKNISRKQYAELAQFFYWKWHEIIDCEFWDNNLWKERIRELYPDGKMLMQDPKVYKKFSVLWRKLTFFYKKFLWKNWQPVSSPEDRGKLLRYIYWNFDYFDVSEFSKDFFVTSIKEDFPHPEDILKIPFHKNWHDRMIKSEITISWVGIQKIASIHFWIEGNVLESNKKLTEFLIQIYGVWYDELDSFEWGFEKWKEKILREYPRREYLEWLKVVDFRKEGILGRTFTDISNTFLWTQYNVINRTGITNFLNEIYWGR